MRIARHLYFVLVASLCTVLVFSLTAHQAHTAARITAQSTLSPRAHVSFAATLPEQRISIAPLRAVLEPTATTFTLIGFLGLALAAAALARTLAEATRSELLIAPQHPTFSLRL